MKRVDEEEGYINIYLDGVGGSDGTTVFHKALLHAFIFTNIVLIDDQRNVKVVNNFCVWLQLKKDETKIHSVTLEEDVPVRNLKPAVVKVYDYYQTSESVFFLLLLFMNVMFLLTVFPLCHIVSLTCFWFSGDEAVTDYTSPCAESK